MKKEQFTDYIKTINKRSMIASFVIVLVAVAIRYMANAEEVKQYIFQYAYTVILLLIMVHLKTSNLKQRAIIRYMTDSISDNEI